MSRPSAPRLQDKVAVVTGASQGLGEHLARQLAAAGARVVLCARSAARLDAIRAEIESQGGVAVAVASDVSRAEDCERMIDEAVGAFGGIDILVLNAGTATYGSLDELDSFAPITGAMAVNFFGAAYPTHLALRHLITRQGVIAYVTSGAGHLPMAGYLGYTTSKHAMNGFFECVRLELERYGVHVLGVNPGDMFNDDHAGRTVLGPDGVEHKVDLSTRRPHDVRRTPARDVAATCVEAIITRKRTVDMSPRTQRAAGPLRALLPGLVDSRIRNRAVTMRSAFDSEAGR